MSLLQETMETPKTQETEPGADVDHFLCVTCHDEDLISLCGIGLSDRDEKPYTSSVECVVCDSIEFCPDCGTDLLGRMDGIFDEFAEFYFNG